MIRYDSEHTSCLPHTDQILLSACIIIVVERGYPFSGQVWYMS